MYDSGVREPAPGKQPSAAYLLQCSRSAETRGRFKLPACGHTAPGLIGVMQGFACSSVAEALQCSGMSAWILHGACGFDSDDAVNPAQQFWFPVARNMQAPSQAAYVQHEEWHCTKRCTQNIGNQWQAFFADGWPASFSWWVFGLKM
eukprot:gnl/MRDRNA2_/MRDRNA2_80516_c0_seq1.p1 gnl/MRDRNA2_/MRDRNA2_80516_c0~~gnl/MRDRNA2_/MRDRNA2_80516_c0_seq1.p1  ORF type:complete len:147 (+),score=23.63 gnl/MRDRNA2_/MRDRNA2_80516_c0_seq1:95-535(+)